MLPSRLVCEGKTVSSGFQTSPKANRLRDQIWNGYRSSHLTLTAFPKNVKRVIYQDINLHSDKWRVAFSSFPAVSLVNQSIGKLINGSIHHENCPYCSSRINYAPHNVVIPLDMETHASLIVKRCIWERICLHAPVCSTPAFGTNKGRVKNGGASYFLHGGADGEPRPSDPRQSSCGMTTDTWLQL